GRWGGRPRDLRAPAAPPPAVLGDRAVFESADDAIRVIFGDESLEWIEGVSASHWLRYDRLSELRIAATRTGETSLVACDRTGHRLQMSLRVADVPRLQAVLDIIDARVGAGAPAIAVQPALLRALTLTVCIVS